ncbi:MFS transporter [Nonomuraea sp. LP-02]|uniref:MFS transporter n=1 Tax=Nonomuraea sp. LP-02 TaxID=3097960 RepID=UPI002E33B80C|nr:MFS transporter [Nonomuraea sp. LP-02]MED7931261.1 MFS transporter [Nonomuraea sp. LP-02]
MTAPAGATGIVVLLLAAVFLSLLDAQIVATALPRIVADLGGLDRFAWVTTGYLIAGSVAVPVHGKLGDLYGRKRVLLISILVFLAGSAACGLAQTMTQLIAFRVVQGVGSGGLFISVLSVLGEMFTPRQGARYYGWFSLTFGAASLTGPTIGGLLTDLAGWRSIFLVNLPLGALVVAAVAIRLHLPVRRGHARIDHLGVILLAAAIVAVNLLTTWAGTAHAWTSPVTLGLAAACVLLPVLFVLAQRRAADPVIPLRLFRDRTFAIVVAVGFLAGFLGLGIVNYLVLWLQAVLSLGVRTSGYLLTAMMLGVVLTSYASTKLIARTGSYRRHPVASMALFALTGLLCVVIDAGPVLATMFLLLYGIAGGLNSQALTLAARNAAGRDDIGAVQGTATMARQTGTALGTSFFAALVTSELPAQPGPAAYADALHLVFLAVIPIALIGLALSLFLPDTQLSRS